MEAGTHLGPYEILSRLGAGGMGEVWRARDTRLAREVAIKILPAEFAQDAKLKIRFEREARAIAHLTHPNICTLFDVGDNYIVMELLEGESLADRLVRGPMPLSDVVRVGAEIAEALDKGHQNGIVHRDLKPGNVMLTKSGAKLLDFSASNTTSAPTTGWPRTRSSTTTRRSGARFSCHTSSFTHGMERQCARRGLSSAATNDR